MRKSRMQSLSLTVLVALACVCIAGSAHAGQKVTYWSPAGAQETYYLYGVRFNGGPYTIDCRNFRSLGVVLGGQSKTFEIPNGQLMFIKALPCSQPCASTCGFGQGGTYEHTWEGVRGGVFKYQLSTRGFGN